METYFLASIQVGRICYLIAGGMILSSWNRCTTGATALGSCQRARAMGVQMRQSLALVTRWVIGGWNVKVESNRDSVFTGRYTGL